MWLELEDSEIIGRQEFDKKIIHKLDDLPLAYWHIFLTLSLGLVWVFDGYEVTLISIYRHRIEKQHSQWLFKQLVSAYQFGGIVGSLVFGIMAFIIGRKKIFIITLGIYFVGVLLSAVEGGDLIFIFSRFLAGISVGGEFTAIFTAVDQFLPPKYRGRVSISIDGTWHLGGIIASLLTMAMGQTKYWRIMFLFGWVGIISLFLMRRSVPESPRWLILKNRVEEAGDIIRAIEQAVYGNTAILNLKEHANNSINQKGKTFMDYLFEIIQLLTQAVTLHTRKFVVSFTLIFSQAFFFNLVYYQYPDILVHQFHLQQTELSQYMLPLAITSFISTLFIGPFFDSIGRRILLLFTYVSSGLLLLISYQMHSLQLRQLSVILLFIFASPAGSSANLIASQVFPTSSRTIVMFIMFIVAMLGGMCGILVDNHCIASLLMIIAGVAAFKYCPNSQNKTLEQIQNL